MVLYPGDKVVIKDTLKLDNPKKREWYNNLPKGSVFTVVYDEKYSGSNNIFCLLEDDNEPKWLFFEKDLELVKRPAINSLRSLLERIKM